MRPQEGKMFAAGVYAERRRRLREKVASGLILLPGNAESPVNYPANEYPFRQDSSFLYFFGLDQPGLYGLLDADEETDFLYGTEASLADVVWTGPHTSLEPQSTRLN